MAWSVYDRNSELLQGVFDKSMFGASAFGIVHLCFEILGPLVSGLLLSVFAKTFTCFLQMRGFSCCTGDFLMTPEGERNRDVMIKRCTLAGNYLQEVFIDAITKQMQWKDELVNEHSIKAKLRMAYQALAEGNGTESGVDAKTDGALRRIVKADAALDIDGYRQSRRHRKQQLSSDDMAAAAPVPTTYGIDYPRILLSEDPEEAEGAKSTRDTTSDLTSEQRRDILAWRAEHDHALNDKKTRGDSNKATDDDVLSTLSPWDLTRRLNAPIPLYDWRSQPPSQIVAQLRAVIEQLGTIGMANKRLQRNVLEALTQTPELSLYFPRVAKLLGTNRLWGEDLNARILRDTFPEPPAAPTGRIPPPKPNSLCRLPGGKVIRGDPGLRLPTLYHPSWVFENTTELPFEDPKRYTAHITSVRSVPELEAYRLAAGAKPFNPAPNELTRLRFERLARTRFAGREDALVRMMDGFFQSGMGKLTSKNNDLVSGNVTLYKFPENGFSSMITTGAKGSKVNYAMICGMLSQQSLEGKRVPVMVSGKTLPAFARFDLGARAGGLITDRYLTGLRAQEFFFHCMAGREGLVDTAVKTARSGYLQRCVMKGMEGVMVQYDGTVRDSDGTIVQFLYGEDGVDVASASYSSKLEDILQNPAIVRAKYGSRAKLEHPIVKQSISNVTHFLQEQKRCLADAQQRADDPTTATASTVDDACIAPTDPVSNVFAPSGYVGSTSEKYRRQMDLVLQSDPHGFIGATVAAARKHAGMPVDVPITPEEVAAAKRRMEQLLLVKFAETLCSPGEAVGCLSAQSMGEPATQMTLNTFHLAGHGAANVTLGIPRLREVLQTAGNAKTPILYIPVKEASPEKAARNAELVLHGLKRIPLTDVIHGIGVESNVFHQPELCRNGLPEYGLSLYKDNIDTLLVPKFFWEYETTIQFENLDHFCKVVPKFTPQKIIALTLNRVVRDMMRQVNKLMYLYAAKYADEELDSEDDELEAAVERFVFDRNVRTQFARRDIRKERARTAGVGFGTGKWRDEGGNAAADMDLMTSVDVGETYKQGAEKKKDKDKQAGGDDEDEGDRRAGSKDKDSDAADDSEHSKDDSEEDFSESELGIDAQFEDEDEEEAEDDEKDDDGDSTTLDDDDNVSSRGGDDEVLPVEIELQRRQLQERQKERRRLRALQSKWRNILLEFDPKTRTLKTDKLIDPEGEELEPEAMWTDDRINWKIKPLPEEAYRFLTDLKVCRKTWRIVLKFGWPTERCPRRVTLLDAFVKIVKKYVLQETPGIRNPRVVAGDSTETGAQYEVQCEGSNFRWIHRLSGTCVDHNRVTSNDIRAVLEFYGVEACRTVIIQELNKVFSVYGITVDYRHMNLIADAMTHSGAFRSFSRLGIRHHSSPLLQMSFETSMKFLTEAIERGAHDDLRTPAGSIVTGKPALVGSGMCRVLTQINWSKSMRERKHRAAAPTSEKTEMAVDSGVPLKTEEDQGAHEDDQKDAELTRRKKRRTDRANQSKKKMKFVFRK